MNENVEIVENHEVKKAKSIKNKSNKELNTASKTSQEDLIVNDTTLPKICNTPQKTVSSAIDIGYLKMSPMPSKKTAIIKTELNATEILTSPNAKLKTKSKRTASKNKSKPNKNKKVPKSEPVENHKLTDFYPIRRSSRKTKSLIKKEQADELVNLIQSNCEHGLEIVEFTGKGRGVASTKNFTRGEFVVAYAGDLITWPEARQREQEYSLNSSIGCYMYYFNARGQNYCIDATAESGKLGRLLNHSRRSPNCHTRLVWVPDIKNPEKELPHLIIVAKQDVAIGEELTYDYGDRDKSALEVHPWLKS